MADIHDRGRALAVRLLAPRSRGGKGLEMALIRTTEGPYDPDTGTAGQTETPYQGSGLRDTYEAAEVDGALIRQDDAKLILSPVTLDGIDLPDPESGDQIDFDGSRYQVVSVKPWNYAGVDIGYEVQGRL